MTVVSLLAIAVLVALGLLFVASERRRARQILRLAQDLETRRDHEGACFHYAVAAAAGADRAFCEARVRELWAAFGPSRSRTRWLPSLLSSAGTKAVAADTTS